MSIWQTQEQRVCELCGLTAVEHPDAGACVVALRSECDRLRGRVNVRSSDEAIGLRQLCRFAARGLLALSALFISGSLLGHLAVALPLWELTSCSVFLGGLAAGVVGALLLMVGHGRRMGLPSSLRSGLSLAPPRPRFGTALGEARTRSS